MALEQSREQLAYASYHQLFLAPLGTSPIYDGEDAGPLVAVTDGGTAVIVVTGCANGPVLIAIELIDADADISSGWEVQEEVDLTITGALHLSSPTWGTMFERVHVEPRRPGLHRLRVSGRGRHTNPDFSVFEPTEHYLIQAWPSETPAPRVVLLDDGAGV